MLLVQYGYIFLVLIFLLLFSSPEGSENKETKISELGKYISYCTLSRAITITYFCLLSFYSATPVLPELPSYSKQVVSCHMLELVSHVSHMV